MSEPSLIALAGLIVLGVAAQWLAWRLGMASILLLLVVGFLAGPVSAEVLGRRLLDPDALLGEALLPFVSLSVALILYEGGLTLRVAQLGEARAVVGRLITLGAVLTWGLTSVAALIDQVAQSRRVCAIAPAPWKCCACPTTYRCRRDKNSHRG